MQMAKHPRPVRNVDLALLRAFDAIAVTGSVTLAAEMLHRTQGAVSQQIARLEAFFGTRLFDRGPGPMRLTADGERLLVSAHRIIAENDAMVAMMEGEATDTELFVGMPPDIVGAFAPRVLRAFREIHPEARVTLVSHGSRRLRELVDRGDVDVALTTDAAPGIGDSAVFVANLVWVGAPNGAAHTRQPVPVALGEEECAFRAATVSALVAAGVNWRSALQIGSLEPVLACLAADAAVGVFIEHTLPPGLMRVTDSVLPDLPVAYVNLYSGRSAGTPLVDDLIRCLRDATATLAAET